MGKHQQLELTPRLSALAGWVSSGSALADIGTDHGYLPAWLVMEGIVSRAIASDLRQKPLEHARKTAQRYGVSDRVDFRLGDGLSVVAPEDADVLVIAGMGGENIAAILASAPWTADGRHTLLLQPMSRSEALRTFLEENGYCIQRERLVEDRGTIYPVLQAGGGQMSLCVGQRYGGAALLHDPLEDRYLIEKIVRLEAAVGGINRSSGAGDQADYLREIINALIEMREEWRHANS